MNNKLDLFLQIVHVLDKTLVFWDPDAKQTVEDYLKFIDPDYYIRLLPSPQEAKSEPARCEDLIFRQVYFQSMETLFALSASFLQAREYPIGWMLSYRNHELYELIQRVNSDKTIKTTLAPNDTGWLGIVKAIIINPNFKIDNDLTTLEENAKTLELLANDFCDSTLISEYNSIKHGMRALPSADRLTIFKNVSENGPEEVISVDSDHGTTFRKTELINNCKDYGYTLNTVVKWSTYWSKHVIEIRIHFIAYWIQIIRTVLTGIANPKTDLKLNLPNSDFCKDCRKPMAAIPYKGFGGSKSNIDKIEYIQKIDISKYHIYWPDSKANSFDEPLDNQE